MNHFRPHLITLRISLMAFVFTFLFSKVYAQEKAIRFDFGMIYNKQLISLNKDYYYSSSTDSFKIIVLKFYISNLCFYNKNKLVWCEKNSAHLVDVNTKGFFTVNMPNQLNIDKVSYDLGIDSVTNTSGALDGDLDPMLGMYWTWQSGYINLKFEGLYNYSVKQQQPFEFHIGGYNGEDNALQHLYFDVDTVQNKLSFNFNLDSILNELKNLNYKHLMSPGKNAVLFSNMIGNNLMLTQ